jgi:AraC-like DNA-binding protein
VLSKELEKLQRNLGGVRTMTALPQALFVVDTKREEIAIKEANRLHIPVIGLLDTNSDPDVVDFGIPANDDAIRSVALMCELAAAAQHADSSATENPVALVRAHIAAHYGENLTLDSLARVATVSPSHLIRLFKRQMGTTPPDYLLRYRISRAKELLAETTLTSATVARRVGFNSESNFSYRFKQIVGQGPRAYRQAAPELVLEEQ